MYEHFRILSSVMNLILGTSIAYYAYARVRSYSYSFLGPLFHHIISFNLCILVLGTAKYLAINLPGGVFQKGNPSMADFMIAAAILFWYLMLYALVRVSAGFRGIDIPPLWRAGIKALIGIIAALSLFGAFFSPERRYEGLFNNYRIMIAMAGVFLDIAITVVLWRRSRRIDDKGMARISRGFAALYISRYVVLTLLIGIVPLALKSESVKPVAAFLILVYCNMVPLLWFKRYFRRFIDDIVMVIEDETLLGMFYEKYDISSREREIVKLVLNGLSNREIGETLHISFHTVKNHVYNIYQKLGIKNRYQLVNLIRKTIEG